jgi:hypothetical protein
MYALAIIPFTHFHSGDYATANAQLDEAILLADEKDALFWKAWAMTQRGCVLALTGKPSDAVSTPGSLRGDQRDQLCGCCYI